MATAWTVKDSSGQMLPHFLAASRLEVARKVVPTRYDAFRLQVSSSYREMFNRDLKAVLDREAWKIVPIKRQTSKPTHRAPMHANRIRDERPVELPGIARGERLIPDNVSCVNNDQSQNERDGKDQGGVAGVVEILPMAISPAMFSVARQAARSIG